MDRIAYALYSNSNEIEINDYLITVYLKRDSNNIIALLKLNYIQTINLNM